MINSNREELNSIIHVQQNLMKILFFYVEKIVHSLTNPTSMYFEDIFNLLKKSENPLKCCNENTILLNYLISDYINSIEINFTNIVEQININTIFIEDYIYSVLQFFELNSHLTEKKHEINISDNHTPTLINKKNEIPNWIKDKENSLIISETTGTVILPYHINDLVKQKNKTCEQIIQDDYTIPINFFNHTFIARFREAFKLAHIKENKSIAFSLNLAAELMFNYNLHPAIITACRNLDELDIYLDCLEKNETEKFKCFKIIFEIPPIIS